MNDEDEEIDIPRFECRLPIPGEITGADRMLLEQIDILRQEIAWVHRKANLGRRAYRIASDQEKSLSRFQRIYWMGLGAFLALEVALGIYLKIK